MFAIWHKQKLTFELTSTQRWTPTSDCRRTVEMITTYCVSRTLVVNVVPILVTNIFLTLAAKISKILVIYFYYWIHVLRVKKYFKEDYQYRINFVQALVFYGVNYQSRFDTGWILHIYCRKNTFSTVGKRLDLLWTQRYINAGILQSTTRAE